MTAITIPLIIEVDVEKWASLNGLDAPTHQAFDEKVQEDIRSYVLTGVQGLPMVDETDASVQIKTWTNSITTTNHLGQTVTQVPGQPGTVTTGRPERVEIDNPVTRGPVAGIPGAYGDDETPCREHVHDYTTGPCCGQEAPSWVRRDTFGLLDGAL